MSRTEANIQYNYGLPNEDDPNPGKYSKNCVGTPPTDYLDKRFVEVTGDNLVIDDNRHEVNEDSEQGMSILVHCPSDCANPLNVDTGTIQQGTDYYSEESSICRVAIHQGSLPNFGALGGYIRVTFQRRAFVNQTSTVIHTLGSNRNGIRTYDIPRETARVFTTAPHTVSEVVAHTVAGKSKSKIDV